MKKLTSILLALLLVLSLSAAAFAAETVDSVRSMIEALPTVEEFKAMNEDDRLDAYNRTQAAYDAYEALPEEEKAQIEGAEGIFETLFSHYNTLIAPAETAQPEEAASSTLSSAIATALAAVLAIVLLRGIKKKQL